MTELVHIATSLPNLLADPWREAVLRRAFLEVILLGIAAGPLGCWVVLHGLSYSSESLAHSLFPGLVLGALAGAPLLLGGVAGVLVAAVAIALVARVPALGRDTGVAVVITSLFGLGVLLALSPASPPGIQELLFGDVLAVTNTDLAAAAVLAVAVLGALRVLHGRLLAVGFDRASAGSLGADPTTVEVTLMVGLALAIAVAVVALGNLLVLALLVGPAATARRFARRVPPMMAVSGGIAVAAGVAGIYLSYYVHVAAGAAIAGLAVLAYVAAAALQRSPGTGIARRAPGPVGRVRLLSDG